MGASVVAFAPIILDFGLECNAGGGLVPSMLSILGQRGLYEVAKAEYDLLDCVECGSCVFVCPAKRNIVHYVKHLKAQNAAAAAKK